MAFLRARGVRNSNTRVDITPQAAGVVHPDRIVGLHNPRESNKMRPTSGRGAGMPGSPPVSIHPIELGNRRQLKKFIKFPWKIYRDDPNWVPPLIFEQLQFFTPGKNPYLSHSKAQLFIAFRGEDPVGRISAHENNQHIQIHKDGAGFFGFFECINDQTVANALFDAASSWLRERGLKTMRGPLSFSVNNEVGLLIDAFDEPPFIRMTYNPPYYAGLCLVLPDMHQALKKAGGRLFPLGLLKILWHMRKINSWRVPIMGVLEEHRMRGIEAVFCCRTYDAAKKNRNYRKCELSWTLESHTAASAVLKKLGARRSKTYRIYEKQL